MIRRLSAIHPGTVLWSACLLLIASSSLLVPSALAAGHPEVTHFECGRNVQLKLDLAPLPPEGLQIRQEPLQKRAATIVLNAGPGLQANAPALAAWNRAVAAWEAILNDNVTVVIDGDLQALGAGVLGSTGSRAFVAGYDQIRDQMVADAAADETIANQLPTSAQLNLLMPPGFTYTGQMVGNKAVLRALGFDMSFDDPNADATMTFSTGFEPDFDYDNSDGIDPNKFDFEAIVIHEIGHALGFTSAVDGADFYIDNNQTAAFEPEVLDCYRFLPGVGATNFTAGQRVLVPGGIEATQVTYDGTQELGMSTGAFTGDGRQASHWKANELTGTFIGIMDPTLGRGEAASITPNDIRTFGLIGWDVVNGPVFTDCNGNGVDDAVDISSGTSLDCNGNGVPDECDLSSGTSQDVNANGIPDDCETDCNGNGVPDDFDLSSGTSLDCNANGVPDECDISSGTSQDVNSNGIPDECDPDCNNNSVPDDIELAAGTQFDCNNNGVLDVCDIADGTSQDVNGNGVPDECEADCNGNGVPDDVDIANGTSQDCNTNGVPDECDIANGTSADANANGVPDECEADCNGNGVPDDVDIANGTSTDNNANGVPDECDPDCNNNGVPDDIEIANGILQDCNANGVPDVCDISAGTSLDCNANGVPDECEGDCNGNGIPDDCDIANGTSQDLNGDGIPDECVPTGVDTPQVTRYDLGAHPNPFNPRTTVFFDVVEDGRVEIGVYDVAGRRVATLVNEFTSAGRHEITWDARSSDGRPVASGVYYLVMRAGGNEQRAKITLLK